MWAYRARCSTRCSATACATRCSPRGARPRAPRRARCVPRRRHDAAALFEPAARGPLVLLLHGLSGHGTDSYAMELRRAARSRRRGRLVDAAPRRLASPRRPSRTLRPKATSRCSSTRSRRAGSRAPADSAARRVVRRPARAARRRRSALAARRARSRARSRVRDRRRTRNHAYARGSGALGRFVDRRVRAPAARV